MGHIRRTSLWAAAVTALGCSMREHMRRKSTPRADLLRIAMTIPVRPTPMGHAQVHVKLLSGLLMAAAASSAVGAEFEFRFWPAPGAEKDPRFVRMDDGPCGQVATARVKSIPPHSQAELFAPERVLELDARGVVIHRWVIPVDSTPYGLAGNDLLFEFSESIYKVSTSRTVSKLDSSPSVPAPLAVQCVTPKEFEPSGYVGCWQFQDLRSGSRRLVSG
jgi:hypothetical protein